MGQFKLGSPGYKENWKESYRKVSINYSLYSDINIPIQQCQQRLRDNRTKQFERLRQHETTEDVATSAVQQAMELTNESLDQLSLSYQLPYMDQLTEELIAEGKTGNASYNA